MYEQFYGFGAAPFARRPAAGKYSFSEPHRRVLDALETRVRQGNCLCLLQGPAGVGKSTLVEALREALGDAVGVQILDASEATPEKPLVARFLADCGVDCNADSEAGFVKYLKAYRHTLSETGRRVLVVVDNADALGAPDCRMLDTLVDGEGDRPVQILFLSAETGSLAGAGQAACTTLAQRIVETLALPPLSPVESDTYIRERLVQAGGSAELFSPSASAAIYRYSQGVPRLINRVCDLALVYGFSRQSAQIDEQTMDFVLNDRWGGSQQADNTAPTPPAPAAPAITSAIQPEATTGASADKLAGDALLARQLLDLLKQGGNTSAPPQRPVSERDMHDFIGLSLRYHQRHVERFVLGIVVGVALLAAGGLWTLINWKNDQLMPSSASASNPPAYGATDAAPDPLPAAAQPAGVSAAITAPALKADAGAALPAHSGVASESRPVPAPAADQATPAPKPSVAVKGAAPDPAIAAENRALKREHERLERERSKLKKQLAAERAKQEKLKRESQLEEERARKARLLVEAARKSARAAWNHMDAETPDAFPEE